MTNESIKQRLEELRIEIQNERISLGEIFELQSLIEQNLETMSNFKPQVTYMTDTSLHDYRVERLRVTSPNVTKSFKTYAELKKALKDYILDNHIGDDAVIVSRSRRGAWGEWYEKWTKVNGVPTIIKQGWQ